MFAFDCTGKSVKWRSRKPRLCSCPFGKRLSEVRLTNFYTIKMTMSCKSFVNLELFQVKHLDLDLHFSLKDKEGSTNILPSVFASFQFSKRK